MRTVAIIQARMGSTRLPGKVLMDLAGEPMLVRVVNRVRRAERLDEVVVATTASPSDDPIFEGCRQRGWAVERGSEKDVLDRYYRAARAHHADVVVRITADCPFVDAGLIDQVVGAFLGGGYDYVSNVLEPRTYPRGLDVEVFRFSALEKAWQEDRDPSWREHVTL
jgi:spore coat polysaccharide biosynthesis protein SpsF (cytidylyltransferase family)